MNPAIDEYIEYLENMCGFAIRTIKQHQRVCRLWIKFLSKMENKELFMAEPMDILDFIGFRQKQGKVKNVTISKELCVIRTLYKWLQDFKKLKLNPAASLPELICEPPAEKKYLTVKECFDLLSSIDTDTLIGLRDHTIIALLWATGLRSSEICALDRQDIDLRERCLIVKKGKGGKQRQVFYNNKMNEFLTRYRILVQGSGDTPLFHVFSRNGSNRVKNARLSQSRLVEIVRQKSMDAGITKKVSPVTFRHTFATHMYEAGVTMQDIKEILGHDDETETTIYVHISIDTARRFLENHIANPAKYGHGGRR